jgi:hypothetical protein
MAHGIFEFNLMAQEVAVQRGQDRENTTVLTAVSASGVLPPPLFVFKGKDLPSDFSVGAPPGSKATVTPSAFVDSQVFEEWVDHFIQSIPQARPVLLVLDNHASHNGLPIRRKCMSFPPHTTHLLQPLDAGCFRSFKSEWRDTISYWAWKYSAASLPLLSL